MHKLSCNEKIGVFMGVPIEKFTISKLGSLDYESNWNYLIRVVSKIESLDLSEYFSEWYSHSGIENNFSGIYVDIERNKCWIYIDLQLDPCITINEKTYNKKYDKKITAVYESVCEFIDWYNELTNVIRMTDEDGGL